MLLLAGLCLQQDVWQSQQQIFGTKTLGHSFAPYLFYQCREASQGCGAAGEGPTCVRVDEPQGSGQQSPDQKGSEGDPHHCPSVQDI